jgi:hypothetical protein
MRLHRNCKCGEYRRAAIKNGECANCTAPSKAPRMEKCPMCQRENVPFDGHHPYGRLAQKVLGFEHFTFDLCKNCHRVLTAFLDPFMKKQRKLLRGANPDRNTAFELAIATIWAHSAEFESKDHHLAKDFRDIMQGRDAPCDLITLLSRVTYMSR